MSDTCLMIAITEAREECKGKKKLQDRVLAAMRCANNHWLVTNEDERLRVAICAVIAESNEDDAKMIRNEWDALGNLSNAFSGKCSIDVVKVPKKVVGILKLWAKVKEGTVT